MKLLIFMIVFLSPHAFSQEGIFQIIKKEWSQLREKVNGLEPDGIVGGLYHEKVYGEVSLLWKTSENVQEDEVIRLFVERPNSPKYFHVTYYKSHSIVPGRLVLRRFIGSDPSGWRNHTVDFNSGEYLGSQGQTKADVTDSEQETLNKWGITNF